MLLLLIWLAIGGLIIGGLGRLLVPGPNPIGLIRTALVGVAGSFLGGWSPGTPSGCTTAIRCWRVSSSL